MNASECRALVQRLEPSYKEVGDLVRGHLSDTVHAGTRMLDYGCGRASFAPDILARAQWRYGLDIDSYAKANEAMDEVFITSGAVPLPDASVDIVIANWVLEHVVDPDAFFKEVSRVLRVGGSFIFMTTNARSMLAQISRLTPLAVKSRARTHLLGYQLDETFPTVYGANTISDLRRLAECHSLQPTCICCVDGYQYYRFWPPLVKFAVFAHRASSFRRRAAQQHIAGRFTRIGPLNRTGS